MVGLSPGHAGFTEDSPLDLLPLKFEDKDTIVFSGYLEMPGKPSVKSLQGCFEH